MKKVATKEANDSKQACMRDCAEMYKKLPEFWKGIVIGRMAKSLNEARKCKSA